jgi:hypothetical protein
MWNAQTVATDPAPPSECVCHPKEPPGCGCACHDPLVLHCPEFGSVDNDVQ